MTFVCLWSPRWSAGGAPLAELAAALLADAPRVAVEARGVIWADARGLPAPRLARDLLARLDPAGAGEVCAGVAATYGGSVHLDFRPGYPAVVNDPAMAALAKEPDIGVGAFLCPGDPDARGGYHHRWRRSIWVDVGRKVSDVRRMQTQIGQLGVIGCAMN